MRRVVEVFPAKTYLVCKLDCGINHKRIDTHFRLALVNLLNKIVGKGVSRAFGQAALNCIACGKGNKAHCHIFALFQFVIRHLPYRDVLNAELLHFKNKLFQIALFKTGKQANFILVWGVIKVIGQGFRLWFSDFLRNYSNAHKLFVIHCTTSIKAYKINRRSSTEMWIL